jgi:hypothetical protein
MIKKQLMIFRYRRVRDKVVVPKAALGNVMSCLNKKLHQLSDCLQLKTNGLSIKAKRICFFFFCLLFGSFSVGILLKGFFHGKPSIAVPSITVPAYVGKPSDDLHTNQNIISQHEFDDIKAFKQYMDSLKFSNGGRSLFDSIITVRPHLMDSILFLEHIYQLQLSKK